MKQLNELTIAIFIFVCTVFIAAFLILSSR